VADGSLANLLARFVQLPQTLAGATADLATGNPDALRFEPRRPTFGSVYGMQPGSAVLTALDKTPIAPDVQAHSIIPVRGDPPPEGQSDGVVRYDSAHLDWAASELVVPRSGHSVQGDPRAIEEVRRLLIEHADQVCRESHVACERDPRTLRIAWSPAFGYAPVEPEVLAIASRAAHAFAGLGCAVEQVAIPFGDDPADLWTAEFYAGIGARLGPALHADRDALDPDVAAIVDRALSIPVEEYYRAVAGRYAFRERVRRFFERYDLLLSPTLPVAGVAAGVAIPPGLEGRNIVTWVSYTYPFNLTGQPAASIPAGMTASGLPVGLQIVARAYREEDLFAAAAAFEAAQPWAQRRPGLPGAAGAADPA
jgi:hypothetical protein